MPGHARTPPPRGSVIGVSLQTSFRKKGILCGTQGATPDAGAQELQVDTLKLIDLDVSLLSTANGHVAPRTDTSSAPAGSSRSAPKLEKVTLGGAL